jgi:putative hemolysin
MPVDLPGSPTFTLAQDGLALSGLNVPITAVILAVSVFGYALVNSIEIAVVAANRLRVRHLAEEGSRRAQALERIRASQDRFFAFIVIFQNLFVVVASAMGSIIAVEVAGGLGLLIATAIITLAIALVGEATPKTLAAGASERYALLVAAPVDWCMRAMRPLVAGMAAAPRVLARTLFGAGGGLSPTVTEAELRMLIGIGMAEKALEEETGELLERVFQFRYRHVNEIMVPRTEVKWLEKGTTIGDFYQVFEEATHTRFPVFDGSTDNVIGVVGIKDILRGLARERVNRDSPVESCMRPGFFVPETKAVGTLFWEMQAQGQQLAVVVDEYGGTAGIVTLEQLLEAMVGQLGDELRRPQREFVAIDDKTTQVDGGMSVTEANEALGISIPEGDYETVAGYLLSRLGHVPEEGEQVIGEDFRAVVAEMRGVKVERVFVTKT